MGLVASWTPALTWSVLEKLPMTFGRVVDYLVVAFKLYLCSPFSYVIIFLLFHFVYLILI